ncbi:MAG: TRAP transporter large permease, partial [Paracoccaceae bacterium]
MSQIELALWSFPVLLGLVFLRVPIALAMLGVGFGGAYMVYGTTLPIMNQLKSLTFGTFSNYSFSIIPLFLLMGQFATLSGMSAALFRAAESFLGHRRGGVAMSAVGACAGFGAICGSSLATAATMGQVALPELRRYGYPGSLSTGALAAGGTLGILIPPSVILVIYAILAEQNIEKLFVAALIPGIIAALGYILAISVWMRVSPNDAQVRPRVPWAERMKALALVWPVLTIFVVVVGGIYIGVFTPTEAAAVGAAGTFLASVASGQMNWSRLKQAILATA